MRIQAGLRLGPYEVIGLLGAGGMGEVWKALDTRLDGALASMSRAVDERNGVAWHYPPRMPGA